MLILISVTGAREVTLIRCSRLGGRCLHLNTHPASRGQCHLGPASPQPLGEHGLDIVIWWFRKIQMSEFKTLRSMMACLCDSSTQEAETGGLQLAVSLGYI